MIKRIITQFSLGLVCVISSHAVCAGKLFSVTSTGTHAQVEITLCLNGEAALSCQKYHVPALDLKIHTVANHSYPSAGIKINTPGFILTGTGFDCRTNNGFCLFPVNNRNDVSVSLTEAAQEQFSQNFDEVSAGTLPSGWVADGTGAGDNWTTVITEANTLPNSIFTNDAGTRSDRYIDSPVITLVSNSNQLSFYNYYNSESGWDGGVLEISLNGGPFEDILDAGGVFLSSGYNGTLRGGPLRGRAAWTGDSGGFILTSLDLPPNLLSQTIQLRWRFSSDESVSGVGWWIDTILLTI